MTTDNLQQMKREFQRVYGDLGLLSETEVALLGAWCIAWDAGAEAAREDVGYLDKIMGDILGEADDCQWPDERKPQDVSEWIPISDRLPEYNKPVLIKAATVPRREASLTNSNGSGECFVGSLTSGGWELPSPGNDGQVWTWGIALVTHWKPL